MSQIATKPVESSGQIVDTRQYLSQRIAHIEKALPDSMKGQGERLIYRALVTMNNNPKLKECTADSIFQAVLDAAGLGLMIDGRLAHAVPYGKEAKFQIDYKGMVAVARRAGSIRDAYAMLVYEKDAFKHGTKDGSPFMEHVPSLEADRGKVVGAYAVLHMPDGWWRYEWMPIVELDRIQTRSKAGSYGPWKTDTDEMRKKTVLRRLMKMYVDADEKLARLVEHDEPEDDVVHRVQLELPQGRVHHAGKPKQLQSEVPVPAEGPMDWGDPNTQSEEDEQ